MTLFQTRGAPTAMADTTHPTHTGRIPPLAAFPDPAAHTPGTDPPWRLLCPPGAVEVTPRDTSALSRLRHGTRVVLRDDRPFSRRRLRRLARRSGLVVERELIAFPSTGRPLVVLDDAPVTVHQLWTCIATVPPGVCAGVVPVGAALLAVRLLPWSWTGALAPGRVVIARARS